MPSTEARRMSASIGSSVGALPEDIADLTGPLGDGMRRRLPESNVIAQLGGSLREIRDTGGVTKEPMTGIIPESLLEWGLGAEGDLASTAPEADTLAAHDAVTTNSRKNQQKIGKLDKQGRNAAYTALLEQLPENSLAGTPAGDSTPAGTGRPTITGVHSNQDLIWCVKYDYIWVFVYIVGSDYYGSL